MMEHTGTMKSDRRSGRPPSKWHDYARRLDSLLASYLVQDESRTKWHECAAKLTSLINRYHAANSRRSAGGQARVILGESIGEFCDRALRHRLVEGRVQRAVRIASPRTLVCALDSIESTPFAS